jgi:hypothetical protein
LWAPDGNVPPLAVESHGTPSINSVTIRLAASVQALRRDRGVLTATAADIRCGRAPLSDGRDWAMFVQQCITWGWILANATGGRKVRDEK